MDDGKTILRRVRWRKLTPLEYMLLVINDPEAGDVRRDAMAIAAAPYVHGKVTVPAMGRKDERKAAATRASDRFSVPTAPKLLVDNG